MIPLPALVALDRLYLPSLDLIDVTEGLRAADERSPGWRRLSRRALYTLAHCQRATRCDAETVAVALMPRVPSKRAHDRWIARLYAAGRKEATR